MIKQLPKHKVSLCITHNDHKSCYRTVKRELEKRSDLGSEPDFESEEEKQRCIELDELWEVTWYPNTPIGSICVGASTLDKALSFAMQVSKELGNEK